MGDFNPYLAWLDIGPHEQPISDHRLLGLRADETDPGAIAAAATRVLAHLEQCAAGAHAELGCRLMAEVAAARDRLLQNFSRSSPTNTPGRAERQIKAPPPVPSSTSSRTTASPAPGGYATVRTIPSPAPVASGPPAPSIRMPPPPASVSAASGAHASPSDSAPDAGSQTPAFRPAPQPVWGVNLPPASAALPTKLDGAAGVTPVGVPLGTVAPSSTVTYALPQNTPPAPPPPAPPAPVNEGTWIPTQRGGRVGKSTAGAVQQEGLSPDLPTTSVPRIRRASRHKKNYALAMLAVGGVCLVLLLIALAIVAKNG